MGARVNGVHGGLRPAVRLDGWIWVLSSVGKCKPKGVCQGGVRDNWVFCSRLKGLWMPRYDSWTDEGVSNSEEILLETAQRRPKAAKDVEVSDVEYFVA